MSRNDADSNPGAPAGLTNYEPLLVLPVFRKAVAEPSVLRKKITVVLFMVRKVERLLTADRAEAIADAFAVEPSIKLIETAGEFFSEARGIIAALVNERQLRYNERPAHLGGFRLQRQRMLK